MFPILLVVLIAVGAVSHSPIALFGTAFVVALVLIALIARARRV